MDVIRVVSALAVICLLMSCSGGGGDDGDSGTPTPTNSAPVLQLEASYSADEGTTEVTTLTASDADGDPLTFSLSGTDASSFSISSSTLSFNSIQSFESPGDTNGDGVFEISIQVSDGNGGSDSAGVDINLINVLTGRIIDGPLADSTVFLDVDGDRIQDSDESGTTTDGDGFFELSDQNADCSSSTDCNAVIVSVGGRDAFTGESLDELRLYGTPHPDDFFAVTPLTTILTAPPPFLDTQENFLGDLGVTLDATVVQSLDPWDDSAAPDELMRLNQQIGFLLLTVLSLNEDGDAVEVTNQLIEAIRNLDRSSGIDLADLTTLRTLLDDNSSIGTTRADRIADSLSALNSTIGDIAFVPQDAVALDVLDFTQTVFQDAVRQYESGQISGLAFDTATSLLDLIDEIQNDVNLPDSDGDGDVDIVDRDDDGDTFSDHDDAFPYDPTEWLDTDSDGIGNNADSDDDNDGVSDIRDPEPLDSTITPPTAVIASDRIDGLEPLLVTFSASESIAGFGDDEITAYDWDFNGSVSSADENVDFIFLSDGNYDVTLTLTNSDGLTHSVSTMIEVLPNSNTYTVNGDITVAPTLSVDSDVNDSISTPTSNDSFGSAQEVSNPISLGGYINRPGAGPDFDGQGHSATTGDYSDYYKIQARGGETINLRIATRDVGDLDLYLYDEDQNVIDYSISASGHESVQIPDTAGIYYIEAYVFSGYSNYVLTIGADLASVSSHGMNANSDLVIGDVIVKGSPVGQASSMLQMAPTMSMAGGSDPSRPALYRFGADMMSAMASSALGAAASTRGSQSEIELKLQTMLTAKLIASDKGVEFAEPNYRMKTELEPNDPNYSYQWHYPKMRLPEAWDQTTGSSSVKVAVLDTGIAHTHPDLSSRLSNDGYDFVSDSSNGDGDGRDSNPSDPGDGLDNNQCTSSSSRTSSFHGTHVAGTIGAATDNNSGVAGVTWSAEIMDLRVLGCGGGSSWDIAEALKYAAGLTNESGIIVNDPADIANMSLGGGGYSQFFQDVVNDVRAAGMIVIAAAGNSGDSALSYPASYDGVVSVAATTLNDQRSYYSQFNSRVDIAAPGGDTTRDLDGNGYADGVLSTLAEIRSGGITSTVAYYQGTSMATPHVAGVAALMKSVNSNMTPDDFDELIASGDITIDLGASGYDNEFGHGRIDALLAVNAAAALGGGGGSDPDDPAIGLGAYSLNYGSVLDELEIEVFNAGSGDLQIDAANASSSYVGVEAPNTADRLGQYVISVDRTSLVPGLYSETVTFSSSTGQAEVTILFEVLAGGDRYGDAGTQYIFLINWETEAYTYETEIPTDGVYSFAFSNVDPGVYLLATGSDPDNDGWVGDVGEALGIYPTDDSPRLLIVNENKFDSSFTTAYRIPLADTLHVQSSETVSGSTRCGSQNRGVVATFEEDGGSGCVQLNRAGNSQERRLD